ncbi:hypothetical protein [Roseomonas sp. WA12]
MLAYRSLFPLGLLVAAGNAYWIGHIFTMTASYGGDRTEGWVLLAILAATLAILFKARRLAQAGRPGRGALLLLIPVLPGLATGTITAWLLLVGFGPHH